MDDDHGLMNPSDVYYEIVWAKKCIKLYMERRNIAACINLYIHMWHVLVHRSFDTESILSSKVMTHSIQTAQHVVKT